LKKKQKKIRENQAIINVRIKINRKNKIGALIFITASKRILTL
jgi:hypothetical protein